MAIQITRVIKAEHPFASPQSAATAALVLSRRADFLYKGYQGVQDTLRKVVLMSAEDEINPYDPPGWDTVYGHGRLNAYRALLSVIRGDCNNDGNIDPADVVVLVNKVYLGNDQVEPHVCVADVDCSGFVNPVDVVFLVNHVYLGHPRPGICFDYMED
jgi:hypothetical protein